MKLSESGLLSEASLRDVWDDRARHGVDLLSLFHGRRSAYGTHLAQIRRHRKARKKAREKLLAAQLSGSPTSSHEEKLQKRSRQFDRSISRYLLKVQEDLTDTSYDLRVVPGKTPVGGAKQTYRLKSTSYDVTFFAARILQRDISKSFRLRPVGRTELVRAFVSSIRGKWPKTVVRADVDSFYESVPHADLLAMIDANSALSALSKRWIRSLLASFSTLTSPPAKVGLPRGVGPSAALAEAYLSQFDVALSSRKECVYYGRFVDDVVLVMAPTEDHDAPKAGYLAEMNAALAKLGLKLSADPDKCNEHELIPGALPSTASVKLLGYTVDHDISNGSVLVDLTPKRLTRMTRRVERSFDIYERSLSKGGRSAKLLEMRIRFLTSNTRLLNAKRDAFVGIKFSNPLLSKKSGLSSLDSVLRRRIKMLLTGGTAPGIIRRLSRYSFKSGFEDVRYVRFTDSDWRQITSAWRDLV